VNTEYIRLRHHVLVNLSSLHLQHSPGNTRINIIKHTSTYTKIQIQFIYMYELHNIPVSKSVDVLRVSWFWGLFRIHCNKMTWFGQKLLSTSQEVFSAVTLHVICTFISLVTWCNTFTQLHHPSKKHYKSSFSNTLILTLWPFSPGIPDIPWYPGAP
jgi:hypothetical protein